MTGFIQGSSLYTDIFKSKGKGEAPEDLLVLVTLCEVSKAKRSPFAGGVYNLPFTDSLCETSVKSR